MERPRKGEREEAFLSDPQTLHAGSGFANEASFRGRKEPQKCENLMHLSRSDAQKLMQSWARADFTAAILRPGFYYRCIARVGNWGIGLVSSDVVGCCKDETNHVWNKCIRGCGVISPHSDLNV